MLVKVVAHSPAQTSRNNLCRSAVGSKEKAGGSGMPHAGLADAMDFSVVTAVPVHRTVGQTHLLILSSG